MVFVLVLRFVTIWIFARIRLKDDHEPIPYSFVTIWIFARIRLDVKKPIPLDSFVTIWIFARIRHRKLKVRIL